VFAQIKAPIEAIELPTGYEFQWGGLHESQTDAQAGLTGSIPLTIVIMILIVIILFNNLRQPLIIWLTVPLAIIGVALALYVFGLPFDFMSLLGFLSLMGMLIKNSIVLLDEVNIQLADGKEPFLAIVDAAVSRARPVAMAAITTVLGMVPLLQDPFFRAMSVTIMAGLTFATVLTLTAVPVFYVILYRVPYQKLSSGGSS
jgi:multidrug efflux pump subunit AcrB